MSKKEIIIREVRIKDIEDVLKVVSNAFGGDEESNLVKDLLNDPTAQPALSLLAFDNEKIVGHILFTKTNLTPNKKKLNTSILAPVSVIPEYQKQGIGSQLIEEGFKILLKSKVDIVFVLGYPEYYNRFGFKTAGVQGFEAPYFIPKEHEDAWMYKILTDNVIDKVLEKVTCSKTLNQEKYWKE